VPVLIKSITLRCKSGLLRGGIGGMSHREPKLVAAQLCGLTAITCDPIAFK